MIALTPRELEALTVALGYPPGIRTNGDDRGRLVLDEDAWAKAGLGALPTAQQIAAAVAAHKPRVPLDLSLVLERLTPKEQDDAGALLLAKPRLVLKLIEAAARGEFNANNPDTEAIGVEFVQAGIVTPERMAELLRP